MRHDRVLVVDLLGGLGDLVMVLPVVHALARRHGPVRVLTHAPGDVLLRHDRDVTGVAVAPRGEERAAVARALDRLRPDLVVSTTRYGGIAEEIESRGVRCVTDLWRGPPPHEPVSERYLRILATEGLVDTDRGSPEVRLTDAELRAGERALGVPVSEPPPVVLVPAAGMAVKVWPHWRALAARLAARGSPASVVGEAAELVAWHAAPVRLLPPTDLRGLAGIFAAAGRRGGAVVGPDTGPMRVAAAVGAHTVGLFGPTLAARYGLGSGSTDLQGLPDCPHRRPTAITEQVCWWDAACPLSVTGPACLADLDVETVLAAVLARVTPPSAAPPPGRPAG